MASPAGLSALFATADPQAKEARLCRQCGGRLVSIFGAWPALRTALGRQLAHVQSARTRACPKAFK